MGAKIQVRRHPGPVAQASREDRDRVVVVIRHHQRLAIARNGHTCGARVHEDRAVYRNVPLVLRVQAKTRGVIHDQFRLLRPGLPVGAQSKNVDVVSGAGKRRRGGGVAGAVKRVVTTATGHVESLAGRVEDDPVVGVGNRHDLLLDWPALRNVKDEHVLFRVWVVVDREVGVQDGGVFEEAVVPAGENQQRIAIRADHGGDGLSCLPGWIAGQTGHQRFERGIIGRKRRNLDSQIGEELCRGRLVDYGDVQRHRRAAARVRCRYRIPGCGGQSCRVSADDTGTRTQAQAGGKRRAHAV